MIRRGKGICDKMRDCRDRGLDKCTLASVVFLYFTPVVNMAGAAELYDYIANPPQINTVRLIHIFFPIHQLFYFTDPPQCINFFDCLIDLLQYIDFSVWLSHRSAPYINLSMWLFHRSTPNISISLYVYFTDLPLYIIISVWISHRPASIYQLLYDFISQIQLNNLHFFCFYFIKQRLCMNIQSPPLPPPPVPSAETYLY